MQAVLPQAKNGDELFLVIEISFGQWEGPSMHSRCLAFFPFKFVEGGGGKRIFLSFFSGYQCVPTMFPSSSHRVLNMSPSSQCVPQYVLHSTSLLSHMFCQMLSSFHLFSWAKVEKLHTSRHNILYWGTSMVPFFSFF